jgi:hypothetical protein
LAFRTFVNETPRPAPEVFSALAVSMGVDFILRSNSSLAYMLSKVVDQNAYLHQQFEVLKQVR